ncbi:YbaB/EbfC family nucleoid-associated protein [Nocardia sp. NPDC057353]|uniref:YbaB/EbfC family nucleoid-associated protein n=1 Tax=Nocardia sp. NPDC057353 TaxID=3346104 RepID=UPI003640777F
MDAAEPESELDRRIAAVRGESRSADGTITIETDPAGRITRLYVADYAMDDGPDRLAAVLVEQHRNAHTAAIDQAAQILGPATPGSSDV